MIKDKVSYKSVRKGIKSQGFQKVLFLNALDFKIYISVNNICQQNQIVIFNPFVHIKILKTMFLYWRVEI